MKIGLLGFGFMGKTHAYAINNLKFFYRDLPFHAEIAAVCTPHAESAAAAGEFLDCDCYTDTQEMLSRDDIDIIDICTPNIYHYEEIIAALRAGKHIYCEKPLCVTYEQASEAARLAREKGLICQVVFNNRFLAPIMRAKELIDAGEIGRVISFRSSYLHSSATDANRAAGWKQDKDICGGGVLFDLGSHAADLIYYLCGRFSSVRGRAQIAYPERLGRDGKKWHTNADEAFYMIAELECGAVGTVEASKIALGTNDDLRVEIYGSCGALRFDLMEPNWLYFYDGKAPCSDMGGKRGFTRIECVGRYPLPGGTFPGAKAPVGWLRGHLGSMYSYLDCVSRGARPQPSFDDGAHIQWVLERAYESAGLL